MLQLRDEPERHEEQHPDGEDGCHALEQFALKRGDVDHDAREHPRQDGRSDRREDPERERTRNPRARPASSEPGGCQQEHGFQPLAEEDREREEEGDDGRGYPGVGQRDVHLPKPDRGSFPMSSSSDSGSPSRMPFRSFANANSTSSTRFGSRSRRGISRVLEVVEVRLPREVVGALTVAGLRCRQRLVDELACACHLRSRALHLAVVGAGRRGRDERRE